METKKIIGDWQHPAVISENHFKFKSLSNWSFNTATGCNHGCSFCYVPAVSVGKQKAKLAEFGVTDPDEQWGDYVLVRKWDQNAFDASLAKAERTPVATLKPDGNRAVMFCTTTDPYQVLPGASGVRHRVIVREALKRILENSTLNVRILTRGPMARLDFDIMHEFGNRLLFGMSLPTLDYKLSKVYEPHAPAPSLRLDTLRRAKDAGLNVYVAIAPTCPEQTNEDLNAVLKAVADLNPVTVFHEPINIRAKNVERIRLQAAELGFKMDETPWASTEAWVQYSIHQLKMVEYYADKNGLEGRLHLWPDAAIGKHRPDSVPWFNKYWNRISEWPGKEAIK